MNIRIALGAEYLKHRHRFLFLLPAVLLAFQLLWALWSLRPQAPDDITQGYLSAFYLFPILNSLLYPIYIAILSNRICDMEVKGDTLKLLYTLESRKTFYNCKYWIGLSYLALSAFLTNVILIGVGKKYGFQDTLSPHMFLQLTLTTLIVSSALLSLQQAVSLRSPNQILPLVIGLAGSFLSLFSLFFPPAFSRLILWGYYGIFGFIQMDWEKTTRITTYYEVAFNWIGLLFFTIFSIIFYFICRAVALHKEV